MDLYVKLKGMNFLVIDDDEWVRNSLQLFFQSEGCKTVALETAEEGLACAAIHHFDVMFVDYRLPGINGFEFIKRLPEKQKNCFKILFTAYGNDKMALRAKQLNFNEFIAKPFTIQIIENALKRLIFGSQQ